MRIKIMPVALLVAVTFAAAQEKTEYPVERKIAVEWKGGRPEGTISVTKGCIAEAAVARGEGRVEEAGRFAATGDGPFRITLRVQGTDAAYGPERTIVTLTRLQGSFTFFLRDVDPRYPIHIPDYGVAVTNADDRRSTDEIADALRSRGGKTVLQRIAGEPEDDYDTAAAQTRIMKCQTWLGLSRDMRIFGVSEKLDWVETRHHGTVLQRHALSVGRGHGPAERITRRLDEGVLPILRGKVVDDDVTYDITAFVTLESSPLASKTLRGTHYLVADRHGRGYVHTEEQKKLFESFEKTETERDEETVLAFRMEAVNTGSVPRYAFFRAPGGVKDSAFEGAKGWRLTADGKVYATVALQGKAMTQLEASVLLAPGETLAFDMVFPNRPIPKERAEKLSAFNFKERLEECRRFWKGKLDAAAKIRLPEPRLNEMIQAGLLHLDLVSYGLEPEGPLTITVGHYSPIGSENAPIIHFMDSMGWTSEARRGLQYFLEKQHEDGFMQNFGHYQIETGAVLWALGEHYRYTRDDAWVKAVAPKVIKSAEYVRRWRARNMKEELRGRGYGMIDGKAADPEDPYHIFMVNGYACLGLEAVGEMLKNVDPAESKKWIDEGAAFRRDIRTAFLEATGRSPVIPLGDGTWCPAAPAWAEYRGPAALHADGGTWFSHGTFGTRDSLLGPVYVPFHGIVDPSEPAGTFVLNAHAELFTHRNTAFSQPYYSRHPAVHLRRGEAKPFLKAYYTMFAGLADRETYTFWEHYFGVSPHKTHEEGWFLMDTRWMLWQEKGDTLELLAGIPRRWLEPGKEIALEGVRSYFGPLTLRVRSNDNRTEAVVECAGDRAPKAVELRLPHPQGVKATSVQGGAYDAKTERVRIAPFTGRAEVMLTFASGK